MRTYECTVALHPDLGEAELKEQLEKIQQTITSNGGQIKQVADWGVRELAYLIRKERKAAFSILVFDGSGETVAELERNLRISEPVLRYMTVRIDPDRPPLDLGRGRHSDSGEGEGENSEKAEAAAPEEGQGSPQEAPAEPGPQA